MANNARPKFMIGCNYWASNAGVYMWRNFDESTVKKDLEFLAENGVDTIRIFPLWTDFQPIEDMKCLATNGIRMFDKPLPNTELGKAGIDERMMIRFKKVLDLASECGMSVIVALLTGWMSGRLFIPPALANEDALASPLSIRWQKRFIKTFITYFKGEPSIIAWEPGNECNCLSRSASADGWTAWLSAITDAIRCADPSRPVYAGIHGLSCRDLWRIEDAAEHTDMLTTHPYPLFTGFCGKERIISMRAALHAAAESVYYSGVGNKSCLVEEIGTLGHMIISDDFAAEYLETSLISSFAYGTEGFLWWCAFDQNMFDFSPYDSLCNEIDLGLAYNNQKAKKTLLKLNEVKSKLSGIIAPSPIKDAVVILTNLQNQWASAYGSFMLGVQNGINFDFMYENQPLKESPYYILPCITGTYGIPKSLNKQLAEKIFSGANLLITYNGGVIGNFEELTGLKVLGREDDAAKQKTFEINKVCASVNCAVNLNLMAVGAEVLISDEKNNILLSKNKYGNGYIYFFNAPLEQYYTESQYPCETELYNVYKLFFDDRKKVIEIGSKYCGLTVHQTGENKLTVILINYENETSAPFMVYDDYCVTNVKFCHIEKNQIIFKGKWAILKLSK